MKIENRIKKRIETAKGILLKLEKRMIETTSEDIVEESSYWEGYLDALKWTKNAIDCTKGEL